MDPRNIKIALKVQKSRTLHSTFCDISKYSSARCFSASVASGSTKITSFSPINSWYVTKPSPSLSKAANNNLPLPVSWYPYWPLYKLLPRNVAIAIQVELLEDVFRLTLLVHQQLTKRLIYFRRPSFVAKHAHN